MPFSRPEQRVGDAFAAGFLYGWLGGEPPARWGLYGAVAGAHACTVASTRTEAIGLDELIGRVASLDGASSAVRDGAVAGDRA
ncbi:hypothetical protein [Streptomyces sp. AC602_WCS936]|uniref:hypothetical protein n=1 Tax=Streptomyces sp. AC602_WCS936 TaxID=2823685 RepID=UPI0035B0BF9E